MWENAPGTVEYKKPHACAYGLGEELVSEAGQVRVKARCYIAIKRAENKSSVTYQHSSLVGVYVEQPAERGGRTVVSSHGRRSGEV